MGNRGNYHSNNIKLLIIANIYLQLTLKYCANLCTHINTYIVTSHLTSHSPRGIGTGVVKARQVKLFTSKT